MSENNIAECSKCGAIHVETRDCPVCKLREDTTTLLERLAFMFTTQGD